MSNTRWSGRLRSRSTRSAEQDDLAPEFGNAARETEGYGRRGNTRHSPETSTSSAYSTMPGSSSTNGISPFSAAGNALSGFSSFVRSTFKRKRTVSTGQSERGSERARDRGDLGGVNDDDLSEMEVEEHLQAHGKAGDKGKGRRQEHSTKLSSETRQGDSNEAEGSGSAKKAKTAAEPSREADAIPVAEAPTIDTLTAELNDRAERMMRQLSTSITDSLASARVSFGLPATTLGGDDRRAFAELTDDERELLRAYFRCGDESNNRYLRRRAAAIALLAPRQSSADSSTSSSLAGRMRPRTLTPDSNMSATSSAARVLRQVTPDNPLSRREIAAAASALASRSRRHNTPLPGSTLAPGQTNGAALRTLMGNNGSNAAFAEHLNASSTSTLGALLGDILGSSPLASDGAHPLAGLLQRDPNYRRHGTTSVIVQGALVARTLPSTTPPRPSQSVEEPNGPDPDAEVAESSTSSTALPSQPWAPPASGAEDGAQDSQAATLEEQSRMLTRLLSVAAAATAASLMTSNVSPGLSTNNISPQQGTTSDSTAQASDPVAGIPSMLDSAGHPFSPTPMTTSSSSSRLARGLGSTLRDRLARIAPRSRLAPATTASDSQNDNSLEHRSESTPIESASEGARGDGAAASAARNASILSDLLRETMSRNFVPDNATPASTSQGRPRSASASTASAVRTHPSVDGMNEGERATFEHASQAQRVNETLEQVRTGNLDRGPSGSFARFVHDLIGDLDVAVRASQPGAGGLGGIGAGARRAGLSTTQSGAELLSGAHGPSSSAGDLPDSEGDLRRRGDLSSGQVSFFRLFRFAPFPSAASSDRNALIPTLVVGVRSLGIPSPPPADAPAGRAEPSADSTSFYSTGSNSTDTPMTDASAPPPPIGENELPASRFVMFVSGGMYTEAHPLLSSPDPGREVLILIELLSLMTGVLQGGLDMNKPPTTTAADIERAGLLLLNGKDLNEACEKGQILSITVEKCLVCLEEWQNDDKCRVLNCKHGFHSQCVDEWLTMSSNSCPVCRRPGVAKTSTQSPPVHPSAQTGPSDVPSASFR